MPAAVPTDYGRELEFGIFPTPEAARLNELLALVQLAEVEGLDLVSVQDHPYQAKYLDTWTLLSVLGGRTSSIRLAPNVASLPLRPPVVLAKAAATLDLVTGGRVELGLGAGAFWDAIAAAGGPRRTPREAVDALAEAVEIIKRFWVGGSVRYDGEHYRAAGLHAGPVPAQTSRSGSAPTARGCSGSPVGRPTAGCRAWGTPTRRRCPA